MAGNNQPSLSRATFCTLAGQSHSVVQPAWASNGTIWTSEVLAARSGSCSKRILLIRYCVALIDGLPVAQMLCCRPPQVIAAEA